MFDNRLIKLREEMKKTKKEVADALGMPHNTYSNYESNLREPNSAVLIKIADFYKVSIDYLLGLSDIKNVDADLQASCKYTGLSEKAIKFIHNLNTNKNSNRHEQKISNNMLKALNILLCSDNIEGILIDLANFLFINFTADERIAFIAKIKSEKSEYDNELFFAPTALEMALLYEIQEYIKELKINIPNYTIYDMKKAVLNDDGVFIPESLEKKLREWNDTAQRFQKPNNKNDSSE